ncbi:hypothetical protein [Thermovibrio ammonificans]
MVRVTLLVLIGVLAFFSEALSGERVCIVNTYSIPPAKKLEKLLRKELATRNYLVTEGDCTVRILIGTPAVEKALKDDAPGVKRNIYTFVLFPEVLGLNRRSNFYGVRIFPLPSRTVRDFFRSRRLRRRLVVVPVSKEMEKIATLYLPRKYFRVVTFSDTPTEVFRTLLRYRYVYIFPDPKLLKLVNLLTLLDFGKKNRLVFLTGLPDLAHYGVDFTEPIDYKRLASELVDLIEKTPRAKILPCPLKRGYAESKALRN